MNEIYRLGKLCVRIGIGVSILFTAIWFFSEWGTWEVSEITFVIIGFIIALAGIIAKMIGALEAQGISLDNQEVRSK